MKTNRTTRREQIEHINSYFVNKQESNRANVDSPRIKQ